MQQLIRQQDVSQFNYWELWQVQRGILVRTKPAYFGQRGCLESFLTQTLELFVKKKKRLLLQLKTSLEQLEFTHLPLVRF